MEARSAMRYMHEYGVTHEMLGSVAVTFREHAALNPNAQYRDPLTMEDYLASPFVAEPFRRYDCTVTTDGAVALVVASAQRARDLAKPPAYVTGVGQGHNLDGLKDPTHYTHFAGARSSQRAFDMAGISVATAASGRFAAPRCVWSPATAGSRPRTPRWC